MMKKTKIDNKTVGVDVTKAINGDITQSKEYWSTLAVIS
ncbi:hypothetical protein Desaci_2408 [Desulfosporosinus acidiphilus SJ4]|uniref:Uncharacterized protein n=1 Tax=Desulfosporosinus acidiphilus (strain DSM 22704 / JCM 16185 / SJ4) TaxID=646529 RepID=I4D6D6_DESAJ|nr:hypothetical protein Desaci_2408 [Desulfosporosinus acidiphilus SJ4]